MTRVKGEEELQKHPVCNDRISSALPHERFE